MTLPASITDKSTIQVSLLVVILSAGSTGAYFIGQIKSDLDNTKQSVAELRVSLTELRGEFRTAVSQILQGRVGNHN